jgi:hypothetical protein
VRGALRERLAQGTAKLQQRREDRPLDRRSRPSYFAPLARLPRLLDHGSLVPDCPVVRTGMALRQRRGNPIRIRDARRAPRSATCSSARRIVPRSGGGSLGKRSGRPRGWSRTRSSACGRRSPRRTRTAGPRPACILAGARPSGLDAVDGEKGISIMDYYKITLIILQLLASRVPGELVARPRVVEERGGLD